MPKWCPAWCQGIHQQWAEEMEEGLARIHYSGGIEGYLRGGGWYDSCIEQAPQPNGVGLEPVGINLWMAEAIGGGDRVHVVLGSGEARTLAAQLIHLADRIDLP